MGKRKLLISGGIFLLFLASRLYVLTHPPYVYWVDENGSPKSTGYSDVKQDYERYANMWKYGLVPYYEQLFEYPPLAIPLIYLPLEFDLHGWGSYYFDYRVGIFLLESLFFGFMFYCLWRVPMRHSGRVIGLGFYILAGVWAKNYWYEGLDLVFGMLIASGILWRYVSEHDKLWKQVVFWVFFWSSTALKYMTLPLGLPYLLMGRGNLKREFVAASIGFLVVWALPLAYFRSALSVSVVFHLERPLKYGSMGVHLIQSINDYTQSEVLSDIAPHYPWLGPVSERMEAVFSLLFPAAVLGYIGLVSWIVWKRTRPTELSTYQLLLRVTLGFYLVLFLTTKVFSSPFHVWYVPILTMMVYPSVFWQLGYLGMGLMMLGLDTTPYLRASDQIAWGSTPYARIRDSLRFLPMLVILATLPRITGGDMPVRE